MTEQEATEFAHYGLFERRKSTTPNNYLTFTTTFNKVVLDIDLRKATFALGYPYGNVFLSTKWQKATKTKLAELVLEIQLAIDKLQKA